MSAQVGRVAADRPPGSTMTFLGVVVFRDNQNTVFFPTGLLMIGILAAAAAGLISFASSCVGCCCKVGRRAETTQFLIS